MNDRYLISEECIFSPLYGIKRWIFKYSDGITETVTVKV